MSPEEKRAYWLEKQKKLMQESAEAAKKGDDVEAIKKRTAAKEIEKDLVVDPEKEKENKEKSGKGIPVSSLASVGGGGYVGKGTNDPLLRAQEKGNTYLERIARAIEGSGGSPSPKPLMKAAGGP